MGGLLQFDNLLVLFRFCSIPSLPLAGRVFLDLFAPTVALAQPVCVKRDYLFVFQSLI